MLSKCRRPSPKHLSYPLQPETIQGRQHTALYATPLPHLMLAHHHPCLRTSCVDRALWPGTARWSFAGVRHAFSLGSTIVEPRTVNGFRTLTLLSSPTPPWPSIAIVQTCCSPYRTPPTPCTFQHLNPTILPHSHTPITDDFASRRVMMSSHFRISTALRYGPAPPKNSLPVHINRAAADFHPVRFCTLTS